MPRRRKSLEAAFGEALREARMARGLSQEGLGHEAGRHRTYISELERGTHSPSINTVLLLAEVLKTSPSRLLRRAEELLEE
jgi:transcriptional regulator with XRE-family HTH domain